MALVYNEQTGDFDDIPSPPIIRSFRVDNAVAYYTGDEITLTWNIDAANHTYIDGEEQFATSLTRTLNENGTIEFLLKATNGDGVSERKIAINVFKRPHIIASASPNVLHKGKNEQSVVRWSITDALSAKLISSAQTSVIELEGNKTISPSSDELVRIEVTGLDGTRKFTHSLPIILRDSANVVFKASRQFSYPNLPIKLSWDVTNAQLVTLEDFDYQSVSGIIEVTPGVDTTYVLKVIDAFGEQRHTLTIRMLPLPIIKELLVPVPKIEENLGIKYKAPQLSIHIPAPVFNNPLVILQLPETTNLTKPPFLVELNRPSVPKKRKNPFRSLFSYFFDK